MVSSEILPEDIFSLSDESNLQLIVKDALFEEHFVDALVRDTDIIYSVGSILKQSKMGSSANALVGLGALRGDLTCWITPDICRDLSLTAMKSFVQTMIKLLKPFQTALDLLSDYSVQYALYPGDGRGYVRHLDYSRGIEVSASSKSSTSRGRKLTAILYLNKEWDGGQLRIHLPKDSAMPPHSYTTTNVNDQMGTTSVPQACSVESVATPDNSSGRITFDIDPQYGRLVIFRSDVLEHEVLPCFKDRKALTFWISADYPPNAGHSSEHSSVNTSHAAHNDAQHPQQTPFITVYESISKPCEMNNSGCTAQQLEQNAEPCPPSTSPDQPLTDRPHLLHDSPLAMSKEQQQSTISCEEKSTAASASSTSHQLSDRTSQSISTPTPIPDSNTDQLKTQSRPSRAVPLLVPPHTPPFSLPQSYWDSKSIFVSVASYCDSECGITIQDLFKNSSLPSRVFVGVAWQGQKNGVWDWEREAGGGTASSGVTFAASSSSSTFSSSSTTSSTSSCHTSSSHTKKSHPTNEHEWRSLMQRNTRVAAIPSEQSVGPVWARGVAFSLWRGERYYLQIDSHMRFRPGWDRYLIWLLEKTRERSDKSQSVCTDISESSPSKIRKIRSKPVLTTYPLGYLLPDEIPNDVRATLLVPSHFDSSGILRQTGKVVTSSSPSGHHSASSSITDCGQYDIGDLQQCLSSPLWASGFSFSDSSLLVDCPYDPRLSYLFFGEEISMAARFYTSGYDFFAPPQAVVYHLWTRDHRPSFLEDAQTAEGVGISSNMTSQEAACVGQMRAASLEMVRALLGMRHPHTDKHTGTHTDKHTGTHTDTVVNGDADDADSSIGRRYGLGDVRTLQQFQAMIGVCFATLSLRSFSVLERGWRFADDEYATLLTALSLSSTATSTSTAAVAAAAAATTSLAVGGALDVGQVSRVTHEVVTMTTAESCALEGGMPLVDAAGDSTAETPVTMAKSMMKTVSPLPGVKETRKVPHQRHGNALMALSIVQSYLSNTSP